MSYILSKLPVISFPAESFKDDDGKINSVKEGFIKELLSNYTYGGSWDILFDSDENCVTMGEYQKADKGDCEYVLNVTDNGVYINGTDYSALIHGFITFLDKIKYDDKNDSFYVECGLISEKPRVDFRCVHLCVFPETKLDFLKKCVRSCGIAKYTHIILEFWGMFKYDCMTELSWPFAFDKETVKEIAAEANAMGIEIIPIFNHLGHASACREVNGKHVVLDQNPKYEYMFESYGWVWDIKREDVRNLLSKVRDELIEVCGKGSYFHLGCDEAYAYGKNADRAESLAEYLNDVSKELKSKGRRSIIWHDMMLSGEDFKDYNGYVATSDKEVSDVLLKKLDKDILIADWQYSVHNEIWPTTKVLNENGFDVVCCPWSNRQNIDEAIATAEKYGTGIIQTTWHNLFGGFREMIYAGLVSYGTEYDNINDMYRFYCASAARKAMPAQGEYEKCGWSEKMTGPGLV